MNTVEVILLPPDDMKGKPINLTVDVPDWTNYKEVGQFIAQMLADKTDEIQSLKSEWQPKK